MLACYGNQGKHLPPSARHKSGAFVLIDGCSRYLTRKGGSAIVWLWLAFIVGTFIIGMAYWWYSR